MKTQQSAIELLEAANKKLSLSVEVILPGIEKKAFLSTFDHFEIIKKQEILKGAAYKEAVEGGLVGCPINEAEYQKETDRLLKEAKSVDESKKTEKRREENKPADRAEQYADKIAWFETIYKLIPACLRYEGGELVFPAKEEQDRFHKIISSDSAMFDLLTSKYTELNELVAKRKAEIKNSSTPENLENGNSSNE